MGFFDELKKLTRPYDDEDEIFSEGEVPVSQQEGDGLQDRRQSFFAEAEGASDAYEPAPAQQHAVHNPPRRERAGKTDSRVVNIGSGKQQVVLVKPEHFEAAAEIADHLRQKHTVVLNLEAADKVTARRLVDFLSGAAYVQDGNLKRVSSDTFLITPCSVGLTGDLADEIENSSFTF